MKHDNLTQKIFTDVSHILEDNQSVTNIVTYKNKRHVYKYLNISKRHYYRLIQNDYLPFSLYKKIKTDKLLKNIKITKKYLLNNVR